jgi:hypothetical protein
MIILSRGDAKEILKTQTGAPEQAELSPAQPDAGGTDSSSMASTLEAAPDRAAQAS